MKEYLLRWTGPALILILLLGMLYQILVASGQLSAANTWGGQLTDENSRKVGIAVSLLIQTGILWLLLMRLGKLKARLSSQALNRWMFAISALFFLNTLGNMVAKNDLEQALGTPITGIASILFLILAKYPEAGRKQ